jgi:hypothetical protein
MWSIGKPADPLQNRCSDRGDPLQIRCSNIAFEVGGRCLLAQRNTEGLKESVQGLLLRCPDWAVLAGTSLCDALNDELSFASGDGLRNSGPILMS